MWKKFSVTQKVIFIGIIVLIVVDIILWGNVAKLKSPSARFEDAINAGNIASAVASYNEMQGSSQKSNRFNAEKLANKYARIRLADYLAGNANYESVSKDLYELQGSVLKNDKQIGGYIQDMEMWRVSESAYDNGLFAKSEERYEDAIEFFGEVAPDYTYYPEAQAELKECKMLIEERAGRTIEEALAIININEDIRTYLQAVEILDDYIAIHPNDNFVQARREQFLDEYYNIQLKNIKTMLINDAEEEALELAKQLQELRPERTEAGECITEITELIKQKEEKAKAKKSKK